MRKEKTSFADWVFSSCPLERSRIAFLSKFPRPANHAGSQADPARYFSLLETVNSIGVTSAVPARATTHKLATERPVTMAAMWSRHAW